MRGIVLAHGRAPQRSSTEPCPLASTGGDVAVLGFGVGPTAAATCRGWGEDAHCKGDDWDAPQSWWVTGWLLVPDATAPYPQDSFLGQLGVGTAAVAGGSFAAAAFPNALLECVAFGAIPSIPTVSH